MKITASRCMLFVVIVFVILFCRPVCVLAAKAQPGVTLGGSISSAFGNAQRDHITDGISQSILDIIGEAIRVCQVSTEISEKSTNPYAGLSLSFSEKELLACMAYSEARGEPFDGQVAVVLVALNRYLHDAYSGSLSDIVLAPSQFSVGDTYTQAQMDAVEAALAGSDVLDFNTDVVYFSTGDLGYGSYFKTIGGHIFRTYH